MKKLVLLVFITCGFALQNINAQANKPVIIDTVKARIDSAKKFTIDSMRQAFADSIKKAQAKAGLVKSPCDTCNNKIALPIKLTSTSARVLVFLPIILFVLLLGYLFYLLRDFSLVDAISENEFVKITIPNPVYTQFALNDIATSSASANVATILPPTIEVTNVPGLGNQSPLSSPPSFSSNLPLTPPRPSSSRFIALITSMLTLVIALCLSSFFIYFYIATGTPPEISKFSSVLLALGIGVVPYAFNKVATAISNKPSSSDQ